MSRTDRYIHTFTALCGSLQYLVEFLQDVHLKGVDLISLLNSNPFSPLIHC